MVLKRLKTPVLVVCGGISFTLIIYQNLNIIKYNTIALEYVKLYVVVSQIAIFYLL